ncbi:MAG: hypothetical protein P1U63_12635 [Coxiellaceae bacterium]|nr:hypothetical protein [Coxiellaceae bacterium]
MSRRDNLNEVVKANDLAVTPTVSRVASPRLFSTKLDELARFDLARVALKNNFKSLRHPEILPANVKTQVAALIENRGFLAGFIRGNCKQPVAKTDAPLFILSMTFMYLIKLAMEVRELSALDANKTIIYACDFAKHSKVDSGAIKSVISSIVDAYARFGATEGQHRLFGMMVSRLQQEKMVELDYTAIIPPFHELGDGSTFVGGERYEMPEPWRYDDEHGAEVGVVVASNRY